MTLYVVGGLVALVLVLYGGFLVSPAQFPAPSSSQDDVRVSRVPLPKGLPAPVERWLRADYPDGLPVADTLVMRGRGVMRIGPVSVPMRHYVEIRPGEGFFRKMDLTWYGIAFAHGLDTYVGRRGRTVTPVGAFDGDKIDQGANIVNWIEVLAVPGLLVGRSDVRWEPVNADTARLVFPLREGEDEVLVRFDPETGSPVECEAQRYKDAGPDADKLRWVAGMRQRAQLGGIPVSTEIDATWEGASRPWATFSYTDVWIDAPVPGIDGASQAKRGEL